MKTTDKLIKILWPHLRGLPTPNKDAVITVVQQLLSDNEAQVALHAREERDTELREKLKFDLFPVQTREEDPRFWEGYVSTVKKFKALLSPKNEEE